jgi:thiamine biosynthesis lipoprotein
MRQTRILMGMPITIEIADACAAVALFDEVFDYFAAIDATFSPYKSDSAISQINRGELALADAGDDVRRIFALAEQTRQQTAGYFNIWRDGRCDPSGIVKGWAIDNAADMLRARGCANFYVDAGGDIQTAGRNDQGHLWRVGIRNPFDMHQIVKVLNVGDAGVATSGTSIRGQHIYNPHALGEPLEEIVSLTVVGPDIYEADRFATAAFAMGRGGIAFIERLDGYEGYQIDAAGMATATSGLARYIGHASDD